MTTDELLTGIKPEPVIIEKVVKKIEKPMNMWQYLHEESKRPLAVGDVVALIFVTIIILGVYFIVSYFNLFQIRGPF